METRETITLDGRAQQRLAVLTRLVAGRLTLHQGGRMPAAVGASGQRLAAG